MDAGSQGQLHRVSISNRTSSRSEVYYENVCMPKLLNIANGRRTGRKDYQDYWNLSVLSRSCSALGCGACCSPGEPVVTKWATAVQAQQNLGLIATLF